MSEPLRIALAGLALGASLAAKWSAAPPLLLSALALGVVMGRRRGWRGAAETALWLGLVPLAVYWASFAPAFFWPDGADPIAPLRWHRYMLDLQRDVVKPHGYQSQWWQWLVNWRPIWFLYEPVDGAWRGVLLVGNPFTMLVGLPALGWCGWVAARRGRADAGAVLALYTVSVLFWAVSGKPVQFYYHYLIPGALLMAALGLALDALWRGGQARVVWWRWLAPGAVGLSAALFDWFYPILTAVALPWGKPSFHLWAWLPSWI